MKNLEKYLEKEHYNINYNGNTVKNIWGKEYLVIFTDSRFCFDPSYTNLFTDTIDLTPSCKRLGSRTETSEEYYAKELRHELGYTDTAIFILPLIALLGGRKIIKSIKKGKNEFIKTTIGVGLTGYLFTEISSGIAGRVFHGKLLGSIIDTYEYISSLF